MSMTADEIIETLKIYKSAFEKFERSVTPEVYDMLKKYDGRDYRKMGVIFDIAVNVFDVSKEQLDKDEEMKKKITDHLIKYKPLFLMMKRLGENAS